jgi:predicted NBD/HSP70 family sugar kinase
LNYRAVFGLIAENGPLSRVEIADSLSLSRPSVSRIVDGLLKSALVAEGNRIASKAGRRQTLLHVNADAGSVVGLDIRASRVRLMLADLQGAIVNRLDEPTNLSSAPALVTQIAAMIHRALNATPAAGPLVSITAGVSAAWHPQRQQLYSAPNLAVLEGLDLKQALQQMFGEQVCIAVDNDINHAALGEFKFGAARGYLNFFYLSLGSGVGGGVVINGKLHQGTQGFAGEVGHLPVYHQGKQVPLEQVISHTALSNQLQQRDLAPDVWSYLEKFTGTQSQVAFAQEVAGYVATAITAVVTVFNPDLIVFGGSLGSRFSPLMPYVTAAIEQHIPVSPMLVTTALGHEASLLGAVVLATQQARKFLLSQELRA